MIFIKCIGSALILAGALLISGAYSRYYAKSILECKQLLSFIGEMREDISSFLLPQSKISEKLRHSQWGENPFLRAVADGCGLADALEKTSDQLSVPQGFKQTLAKLFSQLGRSYANDEAARIDAAVCSLSEALKELEERAVKDVKCARTVILATALGIVILLL